MSFLSKAVKKIAGPLIGFGLGKAFGSDDAPAQGFNFRPGISTPGFNITTAANDTTKLTRTPERQLSFDRLGGLFGKSGDLFADVGQLRSEVRPGFGRFTDAAVRSIQAARGRALGNLREQFRRRRVLGSNFASDVEARAEAEFGELEDRTRAQALLQEVNVSAGLLKQQQGLLTQQAGVVGQKLEAELGELQISSDLTRSLMSAINDQLSVDKRIAQKQAELEGEAFSEIGQALGDIF